PRDRLWSALGNYMGTAEDFFGGLASFAGAIVAIGDNKARARFGRRLTETGTSAPTIMHPAASIGRSVEIGMGSVLLAGSVVVTGARVGMGCIVNTAASVDHDCRVGDWVHISPGARLAGTVSVGDLSWIGLGAVVREGSVIGSEVIVGAGAVVVADVPPGTTVVGNPARPMQKS
ncbi:MAG: NeuD/PglB/VioB family sugar acetyltransferase, partial [Hyphomicrobiaceae bacterium]